MNISKCSRHVAAPDGTMTHPSTPGKSAEPQEKKMRSLCSVVGYGPHIWSSTLHAAHKTDLEPQRCAEHRLSTINEGGYSPCIGSSFGATCRLTWHFVLEQHDKMYLLYA
jgi:hypothetical protein